jgi:hypothetical protein
MILVSFLIPNSQFLILLTHFPLQTLNFEPICRGLTFGADHNKSGPYRRLIATHPVGTERQTGGLSMCNSNSQVLSASVPVSRINRHFPDFLLIFPLYQLFRHFKTLPEYVAKRRKRPILSLTSG